MSQDWDPTIVSAKDIGIARANAVSAVYTVEAARIAAGLEEADVEALNAEIEAIFNESVSKFDHPRIGSGRKTGDTAYAAAEKALSDAGMNDTPAGGRPHADMKFIGKSKHAGRTLQQVFDDPKAKGYIEWAASDKNKNEFLRKKAAEFLAG